MISFWVPGTPKAQPRARAFARRVGNKFVARVYDNASAEGWKSEIAIAARDNRPPLPLEGPIGVDIDVYFARPKCLNRKCDPDGPIPHTAKPDRDNVDKAILDCLTVLGFFQDDAQVCDGRIRKFYVAKGQATGAKISITPAAPGAPR